MPPLSALLLIPLVFVLVFQVNPRSAIMEKNLRQALWAEAHGEPATAAQGFAVAAGAVPWRADLVERAGQSALRAGDTTAATRFFASAVARGGLSPAGTLGYGEAYLLAGKKARAIEVWEALASSDQPPLDVYTHLANAYIDRGDLVNAAAALRARIAQDPDQAQIHLRLGEILTIEAPGEALPALLQAAHLDAQLDPVVRTLQSALNRVPPDADPAYRLVLVGRGLGAVQVWDLAEVAFARAAAINPEYAEAWAFLSEARQQLGKNGQVDLEEAYRLAPDSVVVQALFAVYWLRQGKPEAAQLQLETAARGEPENPVWQYELGNLLASSGDLSGAMGHYQAAVELAPNSLTYWKTLAQFSISNRLELEGVGLAAARQIVLLAPENPSGLDLMGQAFLASGDDLSAERFLRQSIAADPGYAPAHLHLGVTLLQQGKTVEAQACFTQAATLAPDSWEAEQARRFLAQYSQP